MRYMMSFVVTGSHDQIAALLPAERARVAELFESGTLESLNLAADGGRG